jgi:hypothetical protein
MPIKAIVVAGCLALALCRPAFAAEASRSGWDQLLSLRAACRAPTPVGPQDSLTRIDGDRVVIEDRGFRLQWLAPSDLRPAIREFLLKRSTFQVSAIARCLRAEQTAGRWPVPPHDRYTRNAVWAHGDDRSGLQVWYLRDFDAAGAQSVYGAPAIWDVSAQRGIEFRDLLAPERIPDFEATLCSVLRRHPQPLARAEAPCPKLAQVDVMFMSSGCAPNPSGGGFKIASLTAWYEWSTFQLGLSIPQSDFRGDLKPGYSSHFGEPVGCPPVE